MGKEMGERAARKPSEGLAATSSDDSSLTDVDAAFDEAGIDSAERSDGTTETELRTSLLRLQRKYEAVREDRRNVTFERDRLRESVDDLASEVDALARERDHVDALRRAAERTARANEAELQRFEQRFDMVWERFREMERIAHESKEKMLRRVTEHRREAEAFKREAEELRQSESFRLGHTLILAVTWPGRLLRRLISTVKGK